MPDYFFPAFRHSHMIFPASYSKSNTSSSRLWTCRVYFQYQQYGRPGCVPFRRQQYVQGISISITSTMDVQVAFLSTTGSPAVWTPSVYPFHRQQYGRPGCIPFHQQYGRPDTGCVPFRCQQYERPGLIPFYDYSSVDVQGVSLSTSSSMAMLGH